MTSPSPRTSSVSLDNDIEIGMSSAMARNLKIKENTSVGVSLINHVNSLRSCTVACNNCDDYSIIESSTNIIRNSLLDQVTVVNVGQSLSVQLNSKISINLVVERLDPPFNYGRMQVDTDLILNCPVPVAKPIPQQDKEKNVIEPPSFMRQKKVENDAVETPSYTRQRKPENGLKRSSFMERSATEDFGKLRRNQSFTSPEIDHKKNNEKIAAFENMLDERKANMRNSILSKLDELKSSQVSEPIERPLMNSASVSSMSSGSRSTTVDSKSNSSERTEKSETPTRRLLENSIKDTNERSLRPSATVANIPSSSRTENVSYGKVDNRRHVENLVKYLEKEHKTILYYRVLFDQEKDSKFSQVNEVFLQKSNKIDPNFNFVVTSKTDKNYSVKLKFVEPESKLANDILEISSFLAGVLNVELYEKVSLQELKILTNIVEKIEIVPATKLHLQIANDVVDKFKKYVVRNTRISTMVVNNHQIFKLNDYVVKIELHPTSLPCCQIDSNCFRDCSVEVSQEKVDETLKNSVLTKKKDDKNSDLDDILKFSKYDKIVESSVDSICETLVSRRYFINTCCNAVISGGLKI